MAKANLAGIELAHMATGLFDPLFRAHLEMSTRTVRRARAARTTTAPCRSPSASSTSAASPSRSASMAPDELLDLVMAFEAASIDLVAEHGGRLVKLIGDEVMFSTVEPAEACAIATGLVATGRPARRRRPRRPRPRAGHHVSGGDLYGEIVNLAARIVDIAVPGEILVNEAVTARADGLQFEPAGRRQLKGFAEPVQVVERSSG